MLLRRQVETKFTALELIRDLADCVGLVSRLLTEDDLAHKVVEVAQEEIARSASCTPRNRQRKYSNRAIQYTQREHKMSRPMNKEQTMSNGQVRQEVKT